MVLKYLADQKCMGVELHLVSYKVGRPDLKRILLIIPEMRILAMLRGFEQFKTLFNSYAHDTHNLNMTEMAGSVLIKSMKVGPINLLKSKWTSP